MRQGACKWGAKGAKRRCGMGQRLSINKHRHFYGLSKVTYAPLIDHSVFCICACLSCTPPTDSERERGRARKTTRERERTREAAQVREMKNVVAALKLISCGVSNTNWFLGHAAGGGKNRFLKLKANNEKTEKIKSDLVDDAQTKDTLHFFLNDFSFL